MRFFINSMISDRLDRFLSKKLENLTRIDLSFLLRMSEVVGRKTLLNRTTCRGIIESRSLREIDENCW